MEILTLLAIHNFFCDEGIVCENLIGECVIIGFLGTVITVIFLIWFNRNN